MSCCRGCFGFFVGVVGVAGRALQPFLPFPKQIFRASAFVFDSVANFVRFVKTLGSKPPNSYKKKNQTESSAEQFCFGNGHNSPFLPFCPFCNSCDSKLNDCTLVICQFFRSGNGHNSPFLYIALSLVWTFRACICLSLLVLSACYFVCTGNRHNSLFQLAGLLAQETSL